MQHSPFFLQDRAKNLATQAVDQGITRIGRWDGMFLYLSQSQQTVQLQLKNWLVSTMIASFERQGMLSSSLEISYVQGGIYTPADRAGIMKLALQDHDLPKSKKILTEEDIVPHLETIIQLLETRVHNPNQIL